MRLVGLVSLAFVLSCANGREAPARPNADGQATPRDEEHKGITGPHGDHTPRHGGLVLMNGDVHYEVVLGANGRHQVWFSDAMRNELPASIVRGVSLEIVRPDAPVEAVELAIDEAGEAWTAAGRPLAGDGIMVKVRYTLDGKQLEIEIPYAANSR
jgi:hypothetical protein